MNWIQNMTRERFENTHGLRQGDGLTDVIFNVALDKVIRDMGMDIKDVI